MLPQLKEQTSSLKALLSSKVDQLIDKAPVMLEDQQIFTTLLSNLFNEIWLIRDLFKYYSPTFIEREAMINPLTTSWCSDNTRVIYGYALTHTRHWLLSLLKFEIYLRILIHRANLKLEDLRLFPDSGNFLYYRSTNDPAKITETFKHYHRPDKDKSTSFSNIYNIHHDQFVQELTRVNEFIIQEILSSITFKEAYNHNLFSIASFICCDQLPNFVISEFF